MTTRESFLTQVTPTTAEEQALFKQISTLATRSERSSWERKLNNLMAVMVKLKPIEDQIIALNAQRGPILDELNEIRTMMVHTCVHPQEQLVMQEVDVVQCKFCNRRLKLVKDGSTKT